MKNKIYKIKFTAGALAALLLVFWSCTGNFEKFNTDPNSAQDIDLTSLITTMQMDAQYPTTGETTTPVNRYQTGWNLLADHYAGYMACANHFDGGSNPMVYNLTANNWSNTVFEVAFTQVMPAWLQLKYGHDKGELSDEGMAIADILKVLTLHRASDMYGPLPVLRFGESRNPYDAQDVLYKHFFEVIDNAIEVLEEYVAISPDGRPLARVDAIYAGDFNKWLKFANSLKLRLAMRIRYAEPSLAETYAQQAIAGGVITSVDDNAELKTFGSITINNPMEMIWNSYNDARMGASMDSYLNGYQDPRRGKMFQPAAIDGQFHGVRNGLPSTEQKFYTNMSAPNIQIDTPMKWLTASEVAFLMAEYELIYGSTTSAQQYYEDGIYYSFIENGLSGGEADEYATRTNKPAYFTDASENPTKYNTSALGTVDIAWKTDGNELERIITQKWIALYPNGMEAWAEFRRTGFPKIFPIQQNSSDPSINKNTQIRRMVFPKIEYANNAGAVNAAARLLDSGQDNGGSKLWWDKK